MQLLETSELDGIRPEDLSFVENPNKDNNIPAKVTGSFAYMHDFRLPDMLHARVIRQVETPDAMRSGAPFG